MMKSDSIPPISQIFLIPLPLMLLQPLGLSDSNLLIGLILITPFLVLGKKLIKNINHNTLLILFFSLIVLSACYINLVIYSDWYPLGWHNLMQMDAIYSSNAGNIDLYYYKEGLSYPYLGLLPLSYIARVFDLSPLQLYLVLNGLCLALWFGIYAKYVSLTSPQAGSIICNSAIAITFLYSGAVVFLYLWLAEGLSYLLSTQVLGVHLPKVEMRVSPFYAKFLHIDAMTLGLPSLACQYYFSQIRSKQGQLISALFGVQTILSYPLLGPIVILIPAAFFLFRPGLRILDTLIGLLLVTTLFFTLESIPRDHSQPSFHFHKLSFHYVINAVLICLPFLIIILFRAYRLKSIKDMSVELFILLASVIAFCIVTLPAGVQYKFLLGSMTILGFTISAELTYIFSRTKRHQLLLITTLLFTGYIICVMEIGLNHPKFKYYKPEIEHSGYFIETKESIEIKSQLKSRGVKVENSLIISDTEYPLSSMLRIPVYFSLNPNGLSGYGMTYQNINTAVKGLSKEQFNAREMDSLAIVNAGNQEIINTLKNRHDIEHLILISEFTLPWCEENSFSISTSQPTLKEISICVR